MTEMLDAEDALSSLPGSTPSEMFPVLTSAQEARVLAQGQSQGALPNRVGRNRKTGQLDHDVLPFKKATEAKKLELDISTLVKE